MYIITISVNRYNYNVNIYKRSVIAFILVFKELINSVFWNPMLYKLKHSGYTYPLACI